MSKEKSKKDQEEKARLEEEEKAENELADHAAKAVEGEPAPNPPSAISPDIIKRDQRDRFNSKQ